MNLCSGDDIKKTALLCCLDTTAVKHVSHVWCRAVPAKAACITVCTDALTSLPLQKTRLL